MNYTKLRKALGLFGTKTLVSVVLTLAAMPALAPRSYATDSETAQLKVNDETANAGSVVGAANITNAANFFFTGKTQTGSAATSTGAYVTITATTMSFFQPYLTPDTSVGTAGVITYASTLATNTMGSLCDYLNNLGVRYRCILQGAKRDDLPGVVLKTQTETNGTGNLAAAGGLSVLNTTNTYVSLGIIPAAGRRVVLKQCIVSGESVLGPTGSNMYVYGQLRKFGAVASKFAVDPFGVVADDTYNVWTSSTVNNTSQTIPSSNALPRWIEFAQDAHVVVRVGVNGGTGAQTGANFVRCAWDER